MNRLLATVAVLLVLTSGCLSSSGKEDDALALPVALDAEGFVPIQFKGFRFLEQDLGGGESGLRLHADIYLPDGPLNATAPTKFPTLLLLSPYWGGGTDGSPFVGYTPYDFLVGRLLPRGYAVVFGDLGGNGGSEGCWDFMGPVERQSAYNMVEAIAAQDWSDGQVGMFGLSYDGMTQVMASSDAAPHLVTVVPASALTEAYKGLKMHGVHYGSGWRATMASYEQSSVMGPGVGDEARQAGWLETVQRSPQCMAQNHLGDDATGAYSDYYRQRDFRPLASQVTASVFVTQGFFDAAVKPDNFGAWFNGIPTEKKAWLGWWHHQYPTAGNAGRDDMYLTFHRWFDHTLYGVANGITDGPVFDVQDSQGQWRHEAAWPPADTVATVFAAGLDGSLVAPEQAGSLAGGIAFGGTQSATGLATGGSGGGVSFTSAPLAEPLRIAGVPMLNATMTPGQPGGFIVARLWDDDRLVTQGAMNSLFSGGLDAPVAPQPSQPLQVRFAFYPTDWVVLPGHTLRLELMTMDGQQWFDVDPMLVSSFVLHTGPDARLELPSIERDPSVVFLTSCGEVLDGLPSNCYDDELVDKGVPDEGYLGD